jgi:transcriptional antiterminator
MEQEKYISIKEFSEIVGISKQSIYNQLDGKLKPYVTRIRGKKFIDITALGEYGDLEKLLEKVEKVENIDLKEVEKVEKVEKNRLKQVENVESQVDNQVATDSRYIDRLEKDIEYLQGELKTRDKYISELNERLAEAHQALLQAQQLQAITEQKLKAIEDTAHKATETPQTDETEPPQLNIWQRIFKFVK